MVSRICIWSRPGSSLVELVFYMNCTYEEESKGGGLVVEIHSLAKKPTASWDGSRLPSTIPAPPGSASY
jgi:hypothetical protein